MYFALKVRWILRCLLLAGESGRPVPENSVLEHPRSVPETGRQGMTLSRKVAELLRRAGGETSR